MSKDCSSGSGHANEVTVTVGGIGETCEEEFKRVKGVCTMCGSR